MKKISLLILTLVLAVACIPDDRNHDMVPDSFGLTCASQLVETSVHTGSYTLGVVKNGKGLTAASVELGFGDPDCAAQLEAYNQAHKTHCQAVPLNYLGWTDKALSFAVEDVMKPVTLSWDPAELAQLLGSGTDYVIPVKLASEDLQVNAGQDYVLIRLNRSQLSVKQTDVVRTIERKGVEPDANGQQPELKETITLDIALDNPVKAVGVQLPVTVDNSLIAEFNRTQEKVYSQAPAGLVSLVDTRAEIAEGGIGGVFRILLDKSVLLENGLYHEFPPYVVPLRVNKEGLTATRNGESFDLKGLSFGNLVTYLVVEPAERGIKNVVREWGLYSFPGAWYSFLEGFSDGADRTMAMDDGYVYISHSHANGGIYALNRSNGTFARKLDVTPALSNGCTHKVSCVRTIPNRDGKDIVTFCSLKVESAEHLYVYAYVNGTDAAPVQILDYSLDNKGGVADWRRYGDRYTVEGTWQSGRLWFQTWHDGGTAKTIGFTLENGVITNPADPIDYYIAGPSAGIKDVVFYPGWDHVLITSAQGATLYKPGNAGPNGWIQWAKVEDVEGLAFSYGYNFFEFHDENFIAYMQLDGENAVRGRLVIIDDASASPAEFPEQLKAQTNRRDFPIQHESDFDEKSSTTASVSVGDCTVRYINGSTYVAVLMQGCGVSLFQLQ